MTKLEEMLLALFAHGVSDVSIYLFSKKNLRRSIPELDAVALAESHFILERLPAVAQRYPCSVRIAGTSSLAPSPLQQAIKTLPVQLEPRERTITLAVAYDPFDELAFALNESRCASAEEIRSLLLVPSQLDLVVRTGGAITLSDFLPLQAAYARLVFLDVLFNDLTIEDLMDIVTVHESQPSKFGE